MTVTQQRDSGRPSCWAVQTVDPPAARTSERLRSQLLQLLDLGHEGILLDLSRCAEAPAGQLHVLAELVAWFEGAPVAVRGLAPGADLQRRLREAGLVPRIPVVEQLTDVIEPESQRSEWPSPREQGLFLTYQLSRTHGTGREREALDEIAGRLDELAGRYGELDGYDVVGDQAVFYLYGPDSCELWRSIADFVDSHAAAGAAPRLVGAELRFGGLGAQHVHFRAAESPRRACI
jgi:hypothetical protein